MSVSVRVATPFIPLTNFCSILQHVPRDVSDSSPAVALLRMRWSLTDDTHRLNARKCMKGNSNTVMQLSAHVLGETTNTPLSGHVPARGTARRAAVESVSFFRSLINTVTDRVDVRLSHVVPCPRLRTCSKRPAGERFASKTAGVCSTRAF